MASAIALSLVCAPITVRPQSPAPTPSLVARLQAKVVRTPVSYRAKRRLEAANDRFSVAGWLEVVTDFDNGRMQYTVTGRGGSGLIQKRVLIAALDAERDLLREGRNPVDLSDANYRLDEVGPAGQGVIRIRLLPKRRDKRLIDGHILVTPDADLIEISGRLAESPSFWTKSVLFTRRYGRIGGVRVPLSVTSVAEVRIFGQSTFSMKYDFEVIDGARVAR
jgi:hypothetical protein